MKRPLTWVILAWNALILGLILLFFVSAGGSAQSCQTETYADACRSGVGLGIGIGVFFLLGVAAFGDVILGVIWLVTRRQQPQQGLAAGAPSAWYPDPMGRFWRRYWDGHRWTAFVSAQSGEESVDPSGAPVTFL